MLIGGGEVAATKAVAHGRVVVGLEGDKGREVAVTLGWALWLPAMPCRPNSSVTSPSYNPIGLVGPSC